jgi:hypothetical protein
MPRRKGNKNRVAQLVAVPKMVALPRRPPRARAVKTRNNRQVQMTYPPLRDVVRNYGGQLAKGAGSMVERGIMNVVRGFGDYSVRQNTLMRGGNDPPVVSNSNIKGGVVIRHREYLGDITGTIAFTNTPYIINPGLGDSFPWLSSIARSFEQYRIRGMLVEYKTMSATSILAAGANSALGVVMIATQYDVYDEPFLTKHTLENYQYACSAVPYQSFIHPVECAKQQSTISELYVRTEDEGEGDLRLYDFGRVNVATQGMQANGGSIGELWITYEIEFYKPKIPSVITEGAADHFRLTGSTNALPLGTSNVLMPGSSLNGVVSTSVLSTYTFNPGTGIGEQYLFTYNCGGGSVALTAPVVSVTGCAFIAFWGNGTTQAASNTGSTSAGFQTKFVLEITASNPFLSFGAAGTLPTSITAADLTVCRIPFDLTVGVHTANESVNPHDELTVDDLYRLLKRRFDLDNVS